MPRGTGTPTFFLGIEGGGTRTVALLADGHGRLVHRLETGPANWRLVGPDGLLKQLHQQARQFPKPAAVAIGLAGVRGDEDRAKVRQVAAHVWPDIPIHTCHDLETALWAAGGSPEKMPRVIVLSGTGSCCYGRSPAGQTVKIGGWGHILGDKGSGYEIGLRALKAVVFYLDRDGEWTRLGRRILRATQLNDPEQLIAWVQTASKDQVAALAVEVFAAAKERDTIARDILEGAAHVLAKDAVACAKRLAPKCGPVEFVFAGSVLQKQPKFAAQVRRAIKERYPEARFTRLTRETAWGAVELARQGGTVLAACSGKGKGSRSSGKRSASMFEQPVSASVISEDRQHACPTLSPTEQRNPRSLKLDQMSTGDAIELMLSEDAKLPAAIRRERAAIEKLIKVVVRAFKEGGRLFYVGAGTSGRLGILDASECPPTFRTPPELVQGIIAGGQPAIWSAVEGAEDDHEAGGQAIAFRGITGKDVVVGIAASGRTPFVRGALREAKRRGAKTALITFNPNLNLPARDRPNVLICPQIGPEVLTGSTRLKAGTATKLILNLITTIAMVRLGKVISNLMVDLNPSNVKLRDRATRIVATLTGQTTADCRTALEQNGWDVKRAVKCLRRTR
jgi:N-acetylmuramic acid 6-phosphate etherase